MWALATIVVALVGGFLIYTAMTQGNDSGVAGSDLTQDSPQPTDLVATPPATTQPGPTANTPSPTEESDAPTAQELTPEQKQYLLDLPRREADDPLAKGDVDAPVVIIEYADYRCPFCAQWGRDVQPALQDLIDDGTLRIEFRDRILFGEESQDTALAARAAGEQGMYWEFHDAVFAAAPEGGHPDMPWEKLLGFAEEIGVPDLAKFETDLDSEELQAAIAADMAEGDSLGISSTPSFLVNTTPVIGAQPEPAFRGIIAQELAALQD
jgi:protein-disulfide isomerase